MQLRLVVETMQRQPAGEIDQHLLLAQPPQHLAAVCSAAELPVRIEQVELAVVLPERRAGIAAGRIVCSVVRLLVFANDQRLKNAQQLCCDHP